MTPSEQRRADAMADAETQVVHIRGRQLARGNQWYRDRSTDGPGYRTLCGAAPTVYDVRYHEKAHDWTRDDGVHFLPCSDCIAARAAFRAVPGLRGDR